MKNSLRSAVKHRLHAMPGLLVAMLILVMPIMAKADVGVNLNLSKHFGNFSGYVTMTASSPSPVTYHLVESPNGLISRAFSGSTNAGNSASLSLDALINECTNGLWSLTLNKDHASESNFTFSVNISGVTSNLFGDNTITSPISGSTVSTNPPTIYWSTTSLLPQVFIYVREEVSFAFGGTTTLPGTTTNWTLPTPLSTVEQNIYLEYQSNSFVGITFTPPTNLVAETTVPGWSASGDLLSSISSTFFVPEPPSPLAIAVDAPELTWTTGGGADWFPQEDEVYDSTTNAAQSGGIGVPGASWLETTVQGPGTLDFAWGIFADEGDTLVLTRNGTPITSIEWDWGWNSDGVSLLSGPNTLRWTFYNDDDAQESFYDAAFLDEVAYNPLYEATLDLEIQRVYNAGASTFRVFPHINSGSAETESPNNTSSGSASSASSVIYPTLQAAIDECTNGVWKLFFNRGTGTEMLFNFTVSVTNSLGTNDLPVVDITLPANGASGVSATTDYEWMGPTNFSSTFVNVYRIGDPTNSGLASLSGTATNWTPGLTLNTGTNRFTVSQSLTGFANVAISDPGIDFWNASTRLTSRATSDFIVGGIAPQSVTILPPVVLGGNLGLAFLSQSGVTHSVEYSTNLVTGPWMPATNFPGDGTTNTVNMPATNPAAFFRIETQ